MSLRKPEPTTGQLKAMIVGFSIGVFLICFSVYEDFADHKKFENPAGPIVKGTVVNVSKVRMGAYATRGRLEIETKNCEHVYAILWADSYRKFQLGDTVTFHYGGMPDTEVQLLEESSSFNVAILGMALIAGAIGMIFWCLKQLGLKKGN